MRAPGGSEQYAVAAAIAVAAFALHAWLGVKPSFDGVNSDGAIYLLMAEALRPGSALDAPLAAHVFSHYPFPPLWPALLALAGVDATTPVRAGLLVAALQGAAIGACWLWARRTLGPSAAWLTTLVVGPCAGMMFTAMGMFSEPLYLLLTASALAAVAGPAPSRRAWQLAALGGGLALLARTAGACAVAALLLAWWRRGPFARDWRVPVFALLPACAWHGGRMLAGWHGGYLDTLGGDDASAALQLVGARIPQNVVALAQGALHDFAPAATMTATLAVTALGCLALAGWLPRLRSATPDAWYLAFHLGLLALWPAPSQAGRLVLVVLPFVAAYAQAGTARLLAGARTAAVLPLALGIAACAPASIAIVVHTAAANDADARIARRIAAWHEQPDGAEATRTIAFGRNVLHGLATLGARVPAQACVTTVMPELFMFLARRPAVAPPPPTAPAATLERALDACPWAVLLRVRLVPDRGYGFYYPLNRLGSRLAPRATIAGAEPERPLAILAEFDAAAPHSAAPR